MAGALPQCRPPAGSTAKESRPLHCLLLSRILLLKDIHHFPPTSVQLTHTLLYTSAVNNQLRHLGRQRELASRRPFPLRKEELEAVGAFVSGVDEPEGLWD